MANWTDDMTNLGALIRAALLDSLAVTLPAGALGVEQGWRAQDQLGKGEVPHVFLFDPRDTWAPLQFSQEEVTSTYTVELWADTTSAVLGNYKSAIKSAVRADPTLGGTMKRLRMTAAGVLESVPGVKEDRRLLLMQFTALRVEG